MNIPSSMPRLKGFRYPREVIAYAALAPPFDDPVQTAHHACVLEYRPIYSDNIRSVVPGYPPTFDVLR